MTEPGGQRLAHVAYGGLGGHGAVLLALLGASAPSGVRHQVVFYGIEAARAEVLGAFRAGGHDCIEVRKRSRLDLRGTWEIATWLRGRSPGAVLFHSSQPLLAVRLRRMASRRWKPRLVMVERHANHLKTRQDWILSLVASWFADDVVFLTEEHRSELRARLGRFAGRARTTVIPNGVDTAVFRPVDRPASPDVLRIGMQARVNGIKDHETLIRATASLAEDRAVVLDIAGDGETRPGLERLTAELGLSDRVRFHGTLDQDGLVTMLGELDIYVHATLGETMSNAILQAMAAGLPIVASDVPGVGNLLEDGVTAVLVAPRDPEALAGAISALADDPGRRTRFGGAARAKVEGELSHTRNWERYLELLGPAAHP